MKNRACHCGIKWSLYQSLFSCDIKVGLSSSALPFEPTMTENEKNLEQIMKQLEDNETEVNDHAIIK